MAIDYATLQKIRLDELRKMTPEQWRALRKAMTQAEKLPKLREHFARHGSDFRDLGVTNAREMEVLFLDHIRRRDLEMFTYVSTQKGTQYRHWVWMVAESRGWGRQAKGATMGNFKVTADRRLQIYQQQIEDLDDPEDLMTQVQLLLVTRQGFESRSLTDGQQQRLDRLDDKLVKRWETLAEVLPFPSPHERRHWWWFLNEGPQVREQARALAG